MIDSVDNEKIKKNILIVDDHPFIIEGYKTRSRDTFLTNLSF
jgi:hypothetical protein